MVSHFLPCYLIAADGFWPSNKDLDGIARRPSMKHSEYSEHDPSLLLPSLPVDGHDEHFAYLFPLGGRRVETVVGKVPSKDVQLTGNHPPRISKFQFILWWKEGLELLGKHQAQRGSRSRPVAKPRKRNVRNLQSQRDTLGSSPVKPLPL